MHEKCEKSSVAMPQIYHCFLQVDKKLVKMLGDAPKMQYAGSNVNLTITTDCLTLIIMESGEVSSDVNMWWL